MREGDSCPFSTSFLSLSQENVTDSSQVNWPKSTSQDWPNCSLSHIIGNLMPLQYPSHLFLHRSHPFRTSCKPVKSETGWGWRVGLRKVFLDLSLRPRLWPSFIRKPRMKGYEKGMKLRALFLLCYESCISLRNPTIRKRNWPSRAQACLRPGWILPWWHQNLTNTSNILALFTAPL